MSKKESNGTLLARIDERLKNLITGNKEEHGNIIDKIDNLCEKTNHEMTGFDSRLRILENKWISDESKYKGRMQLFKWLSIALGIIATTMGILHTCGLF